MEDHPAAEQLVIPGRSPYQDILQLEEAYVSYQQERCSRCGSWHVTLYSRTVSNRNDKDPFSGELKFRTLVVGKCLSCGAEIPMGLKFIRES
ncbi:MAG: hypothetical protein JW939_09615, partial [Candidatus Thermoplasmatota archaeon]|nr:hypothetical protein [Candidatus Thermoplasmatota archaeon]